MPKALVIVESPTKIKTLRKFLGKDYLFASSVGHIIDLPAKSFGIDIEGDFSPEYTVLPGKKEVVAGLKRDAKKVDVVYLAPDPDREGEAIAWHIASQLPKGAVFKRVTFNAITKEAVQEAFNHPREIDMALVNAQQARRLLDRMVGYKVSPILQRRVKRSHSGSLSAGRVQSVALRLVVDREKEIEAFISTEYWQIHALLEGSLPPIFSAHLHTVEGKKVAKLPGKGVVTIGTKEEADTIVKRLEKAIYSVAKVEKKEKKRYPVPPFITSTLQQEASRHYRFSASRTMSIAQSLYEGVDLGSKGSEGLITYMRTDSFRVAPEAQGEAKSYISSHYGKEFLPPSPPRYVKKGSSQDAHEAIRPTNLSLPPDAIRGFVTPDQYKLYLLIWRRFLSSQMKPALYDTVSCDIATDQNLSLRASGSTLKFAGFLAVYEEKNDEESSQNEKEKKLPPLKEGDTLTKKEILSQQSFTKPPPRYTEASLVKELEKSGIGRPSTYATIMNKIQSREYTTKEKGYLHPTELGRVITQMLVENFQTVVDLHFTANMESSLDEIAEKNKDWRAFLKEFWEQFVPQLKNAEEHAVVPKELTDIDCPTCGAKLQKIWARGKYFYGCSRYPDCPYTTAIEALNFDKSAYQEDFNWEQPCPKCKKSMSLRHGRYGPFLGCSDYPTCKGIVNIPKKGEIPPEDLPNCPAKGCEGSLRMRRSRFGKPFYSCSEYPDCDVIGNSLDEMATKYVDHPKTPYVKKTQSSTKKKGGAKKGKTSSAKGKESAPKKKRKAPVQPLYTLSDELISVVEEKALSRPEVTKRVWAYIKAHNLQDAKDKRVILPDTKLQKVFGSKEPLQMMQLAKALQPHFLKKAE